MSPTTRTLVSAVHSLSAFDAPVPEDDVELLLSTHLTVVVRARLEFADGGSDETGLVIPRQRCEGDQPRTDALADAVHDRVVQLQGKADAEARPLRAVSVCRGGRWHVLWQATATPLHA